ncbi:MAG: diaminopimelate decarboxylase [Cyclobacteriaceae bacterium]|nr:MAG: diaminopimelate decarboxylase [Cyclobacteriaceae bacterium]
MEIVDSRYRIQGLDVEDLTRKYGTPLYVYDGSVIARQVQLMRTAFSGLDMRIKYAAKALTNISILKLMRSLGVDLDVVSKQELQLALAAGYKTNELQFTPNCVDFDEIKWAADQHVQVTIDNIPMLDKFGETYGSSKPCCIRFNPHIMAGGHLKISTGHIDSKFGISVLQLSEIMEIVNRHGMRINGLHIHTGSDILDTEVFLKGASILLGIAENFPELDYIDFGSGFKVSYQEGDPATDIVDLGKQLGTVFNDFCDTYGRPLQLWFEPGKFLVSEAGTLLVNANVVKTTPATVFVGVDSGMNHLLRPMMYDSHHEMVNISNLNGHTRVYAVVGYICETDTLGWNVTLNEVTAGDIIAIKNAGAYGFSMASNYNSRLRPAEVLVLDGNSHLIRRRETLDDLLATQVDISEL